MSQSKISKIENHRLFPSVQEVQRILEALGVDAKTGQRVLRLARHRNAKPPMSIARPEPASNGMAAGELAALNSRYFHPTLVPTILQTAKYARALGWRRPAAKDDRKEFLFPWLRRQALLHDPERAFFVVLTEAAVRYRLLDDFATLIQLEKLMSYARIPNMRLGIIPDDTTMSIGLMNGFRIHDDGMVVIDTFTEEISLTGPPDVDYYLQIFEQLSARAVFQKGAQEILEGIAAEYRAQNSWPTLEAKFAMEAPEARDSEKAMSSDGG